MSDKQKGEEYIKALQASSSETKAYYRKSLVKTEQQKFLEKLLLSSGKSFEHIADIACGGGTLSHHLSVLYPDAEFSLGDFNPEALEVARELNSEKRFSFSQENIYSLSFPDNSFDLVCCWQTLSWLDEPEKALQELVRIARPGGKVYLSSLFNLDHDVDLYAKIVDHTRTGGVFSYNTYSMKSVREWLDGKAKQVEAHRFVPEIDFHYEGRGIGTFTVQSEKGRLQISAGYLMNWAILEIEK